MLRLYFVACLLWLPLSGQVQPGAFPSDSSPAAAVQNREIVEAICPNHLAPHKDGVLRCRMACPPQTGFSPDPFDWTLDTVITGHFRSPSSQDAMVHASGCEPHSNNFAGSYLLTRSKNQWRIISYQPSLLTSRCWRIDLSSGRQKLLCLAESWTGGLNIATVYLVDALTPANFHLLDLPAGSLFTVADTTSACGQNTHAKMDDPAIPLHRETLDAVAYNPKPADGIHLRITASVGERKLSRLELKQCLAATNYEGRARFFPAMRTYQLNFRFNGQTFTPTPATRQMIPRFAVIAKP